MNVVLIFADQMRGQATGFAGNRHIQTRNLDLFAAKGVWMARAYANSPVCTPSRGSLLTGRYPLAHHAIVNDIPIRTDIAAMGHLFKNAGYATGYVGKWHLDGCPRDKFTPPGERRLGFDFWAVHNCTHAYFNSFYYTDSPQRIPIEGYEPQKQTELAVSFIEHNREHPFCLVLSWGPPHNPYEKVPEQFRKMYPPEDISLRPNVPKKRAAKAKQELAGYYAHVTALDELLGQILSALDRTGISNDTLVVFTSDHGDMLHSQGHERKQQPWEESIRVPLVFRKPGLIERGRRSAELIAIVDVLPTILGLAGIPQPEVTDGRDLSPAVLGTGPGLDDVLLMDICTADEGLRQGVKEWRGLRTARYTYARTLAGPWVLYDNESDPYQEHNLASDPDSKETMEDLDRRLDRKLREANDPFLPWQDTIRKLDLVELWNIRERELGGKKGRFLDAAGESKG